MRRIFAAAAAIAVLAAGVAAAQITRLPPGGVILRPNILVLPHVTNVSWAHASGAHGSITSAPDIPLTPSSALSQISIGFQNGDHGFRNVQVRPENALARFGLSDQNGDDPFGVDGRWVNFTGGTPATVTADGGGRRVLNIPIPAGPPNTTFALQGFEFARAGGTDANVTTMAIGLTSAGTSLDVILTDNEGGDLRLNQPRPRSFDRNIGRPYTVTVNYIWIPNSIVASTGAITGNQFNREAAAVPGGPAVIRGFSFSFENGDHHLRMIHMNTADGGMGQFQDANNDDPMRWRIEYAALRAPS